MMIRSRLLLMDKKRAYRTYISQKTSKLLYSFVILMEFQCGQVVAVPNVRHVYVTHPTWGKLD